MTRNKLFRILPMAITLSLVLFMIVGCGVNESKDSNSDTEVENETNISSESEYNEFNRVMDECVELINNMIKEPETIAYDDFMAEATSLLEEIKNVECPKTSSDINNKLASDKKYFTYKYLESAMAYMGSLNVGDSELEEYIVNLRYDVYNKPVDSNVSETMMEQLGDIENSIVYLLNYVDILEGTDEKVANKMMDEISNGTIAKEVYFSSNLDSRFDSTFLNNLYKSALSDYMVCIQSIISTSSAGLNPMIMDSDSMYSAKDNAKKCHDLFRVYKSLIDPESDFSNYFNIVFNH